MYIKYLDNEIDPNFAAKQRAKMHHKKHVANQSCKNLSALTPRGDDAELNSETKRNMYTSKHIVLKQRKMSENSSHPSASLEKYVNKKTTDYKIPGSASISISINTAQPIEGKIASQASCTHKQQTTSISGQNSFVNLHRSQTLKKGQPNNVTYLTTSASNNQNLLNMAKIGGTIVEVNSEKMTIKKLNSFVNSNFNKSALLNSNIVINQSNHDLDSDAAIREENRTEDQANELIIQIADESIHKTSFLENRSPKYETGCLNPNYNPESDLITSQSKLAEKPGLFKTKEKKKFSFETKKRSPVKERSCHKNKIVPTANHQALVSIIDNLNQKYDNFLSNNISTPNNLFKMGNSVIPIGSEAALLKSRLRTKGIETCNTRKRSNYNSANLDLTDKSVQSGSEENDRDISSKQKNDKLKKAAFNSSKGITIDLEEYKKGRHLGPADSEVDLTNSQKKVSVQDRDGKKEKYRKIHSFSQSKNEDRKPHITKTRNCSSKTKRQEDVIFRDVSAVYRSDIDYESSFEVSNTPIIKPKQNIPSKRNMKCSFVNTSEINLQLETEEVKEEKVGQPSIFTVLKKAVPKGKINISTGTSHHQSVGESKIKKHGVKLTKEAKNESQCQTNELNSVKSSLASHKIIFNNHNQTNKMKTNKETDRKRLEKTTANPATSLKQGPLVTPKNNFIRKSEKHPTNKVEKEKDLLSDVIKLY